MPLAFFLPAAVSIGTLIGVGGAIAAVIAAATGLLAHRSANRKVTAEISKLAASTKADLTQTAKNAVDVVQAALETTLAQLTSAEKKVDFLQSTLEDVRRELRYERAARDQRDGRIAELEALVEKLRARIAELEARVGGRRGGDPPGPAIAT